MQAFNFSDQVINKKYKVLHQINKGSFGLLFKARDLDSDLDVAVKIEPYSLSKKYLIKEARILNTLQKSHHVPRLYWCGSKPNSTFLVMELLGKNLDDLFKECNYKFTLKTVLMMADQMISNLEFIHSKGFLHRDINPRNICVGLSEKASTFYSIDFGLSSSFRELTINDHLKDNYPFIGTLSFASVKSHQGFEQTCSDDLESLFYVIIYFLNGKLPWDRLGNEKCDLKHKIEQIKLKKLDTTIEELCCDLPEELRECLEYIKGLEFYMKPDYKFLKKKCEKLYNKQFGSYDFQYDWSNIEQTENEIYLAECKEKIQTRHHHKKMKTRIIKEEQKINTESFDPSEQAFEEQKICEPKKKTEDDTIRRKNSFGNIVPDQIFHIKKKIKIDTASNLMKNAPPTQSAEKESSEKARRIEKPEKIENKKEDALEKKEKPPKEEEEKNDDFQNIIKNSSFDSSKDSHGENKESEEKLGNEKLKNSIKEKFDLLFGKEASPGGRKKEEDKAYCRIF